MKRILLTFFMLTIIVGCNTGSGRSTEIASSAGNVNAVDGCIVPVYTFAYMTRGDLPTELMDMPMVLPETPWAVVAPLPEFPENAIEDMGKDWLLAITSQPAGSDVWILRSWTDNPLGGWYYDYFQLLIYHTATTDWEILPAQVQGENAIVGELFTLKDGSILAHNYWGFFGNFEPPSMVGVTSDETSAPIPILSRFDEAEGRFVPELEMLEIPAGILEEAWNKVLLDENDLFWILVQEDGIYSYNPHTNVVNRHADLPEVVVRSAAISIDGHIFFSDGFSSIYRFNPETNDIDSIGGSPLPFENPYTVIFHGMVVDHSNRLWLGDLGWVESADYTTWYQLIRSPIFITNEVDGLPITQWERPLLVMEDSNRILWYLSSNGITWLDPAQGNWCWITTERSMVIEDSQDNLWIIADGRLYTRP